MGWVGGWVGELGGWDVSYREGEGVADVFAGGEEVAESDAAEGHGEDDLSGGWVGE